jgi:hypothetical protein
MKVQIADNVVPERKSFSRMFKCPACYGKFLTFFDNTEINQGGKNDFCPNPSCKVLLWIPTSKERITCFGRR